MPYTKYSPEIKTQTIVDYFINKGSATSKREFCIKKKISPNTLNHWIKKFNEKTLTVDLRINNHGKIKITDEFKEVVYNNFINNGLQTIDGLMKKLQDQYNFSRITYYRTVRALNFTYKRVTHYTLPLNKDPVKVLKEIQEKQKVLQGIGIDNVVSIDEVPFYQEMYPLSGWSLKGQELKTRRLSMRSKHYSLLCAMSSSGIFEYKIVSSGNSIEFKNFIKNNVMKTFKNHSHFLMDNARIHHSKETVNYIKSKGKTPIYTVPYTPELNPIENSFSVLKNSVRHKQPKSEKELKIAIAESISLITAEKTKNMFLNSFGLTDYEIKR